MTTFENIRKNIEAFADQSSTEVLENAKFDSQMSVQWCNDISTKMVSLLKNESDKFKWIVTTIIMAKGDSGLGMSGAALWDSERDGTAIKKTELNDMTCIVQVSYISLDKN